MSASIKIGDKYSFGGLTYSVTSLYDYNQGESKRWHLHEVPGQNDGDGTYLVLRADQIEALEKEWEPKFWHGDLVAYTHPDHKGAEYTGLVVSVPASVDEHYTVRALFYRLDGSGPVLVSPVSRSVPETAMRALSC